MTTDPAKMTKDEALSTLSKWMGVDKTWLDTVIRFESTWDPLARNDKTGARGLIQFTNETAHDLGYKTADEIVKTYPTVGAQLLGPVAAYFKLPKAKGPWPTKQSLYMSVFYPSYRNVTPDTMLPSLARSKNPGIDTVQDYMNLAEGKRTAKSGGSFLMTLGALCLAGYLYIKFKKGGAHGLI